MLAARRERRRRAAARLGACLYPAAEPSSGKNSEEPLLPQQVAAILRFIQAHRTSPGPFDILAAGPERGQDPDRTRELIRKSAEAGATWFSEWIPPSDPVTMRAAIAPGAVRIDPT